MPSVSVIVPNFNHARYLPRRLSSILEQTFADFELLFLDDASTDNSMEVFVTFAADARVRLIRNPENSGSPFRQWNRGVREARGEYVWIAESDDYAAPTFLQSMLETMRRSPELSLAYCQSWLVDENDQVVQRFDQYDRTLSGGRWETGFINNGPAEISDYLICGNTIPNASAVLFRRHLFEQMGGAAEGFRLCGDWMTWANLLMLGSVSFQPTPMNYFRTSYSSSQRALAKREALDVLEGLDILNNLSCRLDLTAEQFERAFYAHVSRWAMYAVAYRYPLALNRRIWRQFDRLRRDSRLRLGVNFTANLFGNALRQAARLLRR